MSKHQQRTSFLALFVVAALCACSDDSLPKYYALGGLRVLTLRADQGSQFSGTAEFSPGDTVVVTPYVSYYKVNGTPTFEAKACPDPGVSVGGTPSCDGVSGAVTIGGGAVAISGGTSNTGQAASFTVTIPSDILSGRSSVSQYNGVNYVVTYKLISADGTASVSSFKRLVVSSQTKAKNLNPVVNGIQSSGVTLSTPPLLESDLSISYPSASRESYSLMKSDGGLQGFAEDLVTTYFITDGKLKYTRTVNDIATTYTPASPAPTDHAIVIVAVTRDPRGGVTVTTVHQ